MSDNKEKDKIVVMSLENDETTVLFFAKEKQYVHDKGDLEHNAGDFFLYNSHQCPMNWLQNLVGAVSVDKQTGEINSDEHGLFRFVGAFYEHELPLETATNGNNETILTGKYDVRELTNRILESAKDIMRFQMLLIESSEPLDVLHPKIHNAWLKIINNQQSLYQLSRCIMEDGVWVDLEIDEETKTYTIGSTTDNFNITPKAEAEWLRVKEIAKHDMLTACNY